MKIGVFDSGIGGLSMVRAIQYALPGVEVVFRHDSANVPYGTKSASEVYDLCKPKLDQLVKDGCDVIVITCQTVSTNFLQKLRAEMPVPLLGLEPMVRPATEITESKVIAVCATPRTFKSKRYGWLKDQYAKGIKVIEPDCSQWSAFIESNKLDHERIRDMVESVIDVGADVIVIGRTHYPWIGADIRKFSKGKAKVLQSEVPYINQLKKLVQGQTRHHA